MSHLLPVPQLLLHPGGLAESFLYVNIGPRAMFLEPPLSQALLGALGSAEVGPLVICLLFCPGDENLG